MRNKVWKSSGFSYCWVWIFYMLKKFNLITSVKRLFGFPYYLKRHDSKQNKSVFFQTSFKCNYCSVFIDKAVFHFLKIFPEFNFCMNINEFVYCLLSFSLLKFNNKKKNLSFDLFRILKSFFRKSWNFHCDT